MDSRDRCYHHHINGPKDGPAKQCRLCLRGRSIPAVVVEELGVEIVATISSVAGRARRAVLRSVARRRATYPVLV